MLSFNLIELSTKIDNHSKIYSLDDLIDECTEKLYDDIKAYHEDHDYINTTQDLIDVIELTQTKVEDLTFTEDFIVFIDEDNNLTVTYNDTFPQEPPYTIETIFLHITYALDVEVNIWNDK